MRRGMCVGKAIGSASGDRFPGTRVASVIFHFSSYDSIVYSARRRQCATTRIENTQGRIDNLVKTAQCQSSRATLDFSVDN
jgi:hypothetical protein